jgi:AraC-like DNA-binding protein
METGKNISASRYKTSYGMDYHTHNYFEIEYVVTGKCRQVFKNDSYEFSRGDIALFKPNSRHEFFASNELEILRIIIKPEMLPKVYLDNQEQFDIASIYRLPPNEVRRIENVLFAIEKEFESQGEYYIDVIRGCLEVVFAILLRVSRKLESNNKNSSLIDFKVFFTYIENNLTTVTPSSVAAYSGYNFPYFSKLFKKNVGVNLSEYINHKKLERASRLLIDTNKSIEEIGYDVGFNHKSYFHRMFKRHYGVTPEEFRKSSLQ